MKATSTLLRRVLLTMCSISVVLGIYLGFVEFSLQVLERNESDPDLSAQAWHQNFQRAQVIARWSPLHAGSHDLVARMAQRGAGAFSSSPAEAIRLHQLAVKYCHNSLLIRPAWAATWLNLAASEFVLDANGSEWQDALAKVFKIGDRNLRSQIALVRFRKQVEAKLDAAQKQNFQIASAQAQVDYGYDFTMAAIRLSRPNWVCPSSYASEFNAAHRQSAGVPAPGSAVNEAKMDFDPKKVLTAAMLININSVCENALN